MNTKNTEKDLSEITSIFKALGHNSRVLIYNLIWEKNRSGDELALILSLSTATISHHLSIMTEAKLFNSEKQGSFQIYSINKKISQKNIEQLSRISIDNLEKKTDKSAYDDKVLEIFFKDGALVKYPSQKKKQAIVLQKIAKVFDPNISYSEKEISIILSEFNDDFATLRRGMVEHKLMNRENSIYKLIV